jgi:hypothetical protein
VKVTSTGSARIRKLAQHFDCKSILEYQSWSKFWTSPVMFTLWPRVRRAPRQHRRPARPPPRRAGQPAGVDSRGQWGHSDASPPVLRLDRTAGCTSVAGSDPVVILHTNENGPRCDGSSALVYRRGAGGGGARGRGEPRAGPAGRRAAKVQSTGLAQTLGTL